MDHPWTAATRLDHPWTAGDFIFFRRSARPKLKVAVLAWYGSLASALRAVADAATAIQAAARSSSAETVAEAEGRVTAAKSAAAALAKASSEVRADYESARREPPCQAPFDSDAYSDLISMHEATASAAPRVKITAL